MKNNVHWTRRAAASVAMVVAITSLAGTDAVADADVVQADPLCTTTTIHTVSEIPLHYVTVPAGRVSGTVTKNCLIGDGLIGCGGSDCTPIKRLQRSLNLCYGKSLTVDGYWGPQTKAALKDAQKAEGVTQDGIYGRATRNAMKHRSDGDTSSGLHCHYY